MDSRLRALLSGENEVLQKCAGIAPCIENFPWKFSAISSSFQRKLESSAFADFQVAGFQLSLTAVRQEICVAPYTSAATHTAVIPAKAGIHFQACTRARWIPAFAGMTALRDTAILSLALGR
ncbi:hypothetical protein [Dyella sp.]|uniref:hypothetical protein n=1 Tax=Dyella sp. TaxID=1869338 RepID=UPI002FD9C3AC